MASGDLSPWAQGAGQPPTNPHQGSYDGPWMPAPAAPTGWVGGPPTGTPGAVPVTDELLRRLPPPGAGPAWSTSRPVGEQRPVVIGLAVTLAVTGSLLWLCGLSLFGLVALAGTRTMSRVGEDGVVFHTLDEFVLRMGDGLWVPLYGFPVASVVTAFMLLNRRPWSRVAHSAVGVASLGWAGWWLRDSLLTWFVVAVYVGTAVAVLWTPSASRWFAARAGRARPARDRLDG